MRPNPKPKIIVIVGQTSSGKSDMAIRLAKKFNGEVISADSRQIYKGLDIGTGKVTKKEMRGVPHHLLSVANPKKVFTVSDYKKLGDEAIESILKKGKTPIIAGGTGFYIQALVDGIVLPEVPPNKELRQKLERKNEDQLFKMLEKLSPARAREIDNKNKRRLIRAIEIVKFLGSVPKIKKTKLKYDFIKIGIEIDQDKLKKKIRDRLDARFKQGMVREVKKLRESGLSWKRLNDLGLEYRFVANLLQGKITKKELRYKLFTEIWQYAKRQKTWFKRDRDIVWVKGYREAENIMKKSLLPVEF